jgi:hypothetical protein
MPRSGLANPLKVAYTLPVLLSIALTGCQSSATSEGEPQGDDPVPRRIYERSEYRIPCLEVALNAPEEVEVGVNVPFTIVVTNSCETPLELEHIPTPQQFFVLDADRRIVWDSWPPNTEPRAIASELTLGPGESASWESPSSNINKAPFSGVGDDGTALAEGEYSVVGRLRSFHPALAEGATQGPPNVPGIDTEPKPLRIVQ